MGVGFLLIWVRKDGKVRGDFIIWLSDIFGEDFLLKNETMNMKGLIQTIDQIRIELNNVCDNFNSTETQMHLTCYPTGSSYTRHLDAFVGGSTRRITCLYYFNIGWKEEDGGKLRIYNPDKVNHDGEYTDIEPIGDRLLIFQSRLLEHEVLESKKDRFALTVWLY